MSMTQPPPIQVPEALRQSDPELYQFLTTLRTSLYLLWEKVGKQQTFTAAGGTITSAGPGAPDYAIQALTSTSPFGFVTADEGETVLQEIAVLQAQVAELQAVLT